MTLPPDAAELLQAGRLEEVLVVLQKEVRQHPQDIDRRIMLFALECILGRWEKALLHLDAIASLDPEWVLSARVHRLLIGGEARRREVFGGTTHPLILGEPPAWLAGLVESLRLDGNRRNAEASALRGQAVDDAPLAPGSVNGLECAWLADADSRLGPVWEAFLEGAYYWIPFGQVRRIETDAPSALTDLVWLPCRITLVTGAEVRAHLPVRYPGTETRMDSPLRLARATEWTESGFGDQIGWGQRLLASDQGDFALCECRTIEFGGQDDVSPKSHA